MSAKILVATPIRSFGELIAQALQEIGYYPLLVADVPNALDAARVDIEATRRNVPPGLVEIHYTLHLESDAPPEKLQTLHDKAVEWGTVTNTLTHGVPIRGGIEVHKP